jgi:hypothetical protein
MANELEPDNPLPVDFVPERSVATHRVSDGENWASVAAKHNVNVKELIYFNFHTNIPEEVNWYLRRNTGCNVSKDGGRNWAFSSSADPGIIYIPPSAAIKPRVLHVERILGGPYRITTEDTAHESDVSAWLWHGDPPVGTEVKEIEAFQHLGYKKFDATGIDVAEEATQLRQNAYMWLSGAEPESYRQFLERLDQYKKQDEEFLNSPVPHLAGVTFREIWDNFASWEGLRESDGWYVWIGYDARERTIQEWKMPTSERVRRDIRYYVDQGKSLNQAVRNVMQDQFDEATMLVIGLTGAG